MKKPKTFTIDEKIIKDFIRVAKENSLNMSLYVENTMRKYIKEHDNK